MARIINTSTADLAKLDTMGQLAIYSGLDNLTLFEINEGIDDLLTPLKRETYAFEMELQAALLEMSANGIYVDQEKRASLIREHEAELKIVHSNLHLLCEAIGYYEYYLQQGILRFSWATGLDPAELPRSWDEWKNQPTTWRREVKALDPAACALYHKCLKTFGPPYIPGNKTSGAFNANSPKQKLRLFYDFFGHEGNTISQEFSPEFPPPWNKTRGISEIKTRDIRGDYTPSSDRESLEKISNRDSDLRDAAFWARPFISCCLDIADLTKALGFLRCKLEKGYFKASFGAVTDTGRLASRENAQGFGSNGQNVTPRLRIILCAEPGWKLAAPDYEQIESRNVGAIAYSLFGSTAYLNATECGDLHTLVCRMVWDDLPWPSDFNLDYLEKYGPPFPKEIVSAAKEIAKKKFYRHFSRRDMVKRLGHGSNYRGKPDHMAKLTHIDPKLVHHFQSIYFERFPEIPAYHQWVIEQVQTKGEITTLFGRTRRFFGRPNDDATIRKAIAHCPQSMGADYTNRALLRILKAIYYEGLPAKIILQKHDEICFKYLEADEHLVIPRVCDIMVDHVTLTSPSGIERDWCVPVEAASGWNLGHPKYDNDGNIIANPDGLMEYRGRDERIRQRDPANMLRMVL